MNQTNSWSSDREPQPLMTLRQWNREYPVFLWSRPILLGPSGCEASHNDPTGDFIALIEEDAQCSR